MTATTGVGLIGLGTVGTAVARRLVDEWDLLGERAGSIPVLRRVAVRDPTRARARNLPGVTLDSDAEALIDDPQVAVVVEVMGGVERASALIEKALRAGKPVVTANKAAMAANGLELTSLAAERRVALRYEAAVGAGLPLVAMLRDSLRGDRISSLEMIINGTTNVILTRMEREGGTLAEALLEAQQRGFAEADPSADVDGHDAAAKLLLLSRLAYDATLTASDVDTVGIGAVEAADIACAAALGGSVKLLARSDCAADRVCLRVAPCLVLAGHPLHGVDDAENALLATSDLAGAILVRGPGAGGDSTASAVVSDIVATVRHPDRAQRVATRSLPTGIGAAPDGSWYIRLVLGPALEAAQLAVQALEDRGIPVRASTAAGGPRQVALVTGPVDAQILERATQTLDSLTAVVAVAAVMRCVGPPE